MRWHIMIGAKTFGPLDSETIGEMLRERKLGPGAFLRDESGGHWVAIEQSPFRGLVRRRLLDVALRVVAWVVGVYALVWIPWFLYNVLTH